MTSPHRRHSQLFVELPMLSPRPSVTKSKENLVPASPTMLKPRMSKPSMDDILKDKSTDSNTSSTPTGVKRKANGTEDDKPAKKKLKAATEATSEGTEASDDHRRCHQCARKMPLSSLLRCTRIRRSTQCLLHYCKSCLSSRYGEDLTEIKAAGVNPSSLDRNLHITTAVEYYWSCPRCSGECNCRICRKASGLPATGMLATADGESARDVLRKNVHATAPKPAKATNGKAESSAQPASENKKKPVTARSSNASSSSKSSSSASGSSAPKRSEAKAANPRTVIAKVEPVKVPAPPKVSRLPDWSKINTDMSREDVEDRIYLREFIVRFGPLLNVAKLHMESLDDFDHMSDATVKALVVALLDLIAVEEESPKRKLFVGAVKDARASNTASKLWNVLDRLRTQRVFDCPEPLLPDASRPNTRHADAVSQAGQLLPALLALCDRVMEGPSVRNDIEEQSKIHPQFKRDSLYVPLKTLNEAWVLEKQALLDKKPKDDSKNTEWKAQYKKAESKHRAAVADLEQGTYELDASYSPRFGPIGRDHAGRVYYILSSQKVKKLPSESDRTSFGRWAWFVAIWGVPLEKSGNDDQSDRWMGVSDPKEIKHTAKWLVASAQHAEFEAAQRQESPDPLELTSPLSPLTSNGSTSTLSSLTDSENNDDAMSDLSSLTEDEDDAMEVDKKSQRAAEKTSRSVQHQLSRYYGPRPTVAEVKAMAKEMEEFSDYLQWRLTKEAAR